MRIVAWNIRAGGGRRVEQIAAQINAWQPDVVVLSEFRGTPPSRWLGEELALQGLPCQLTTADPAKPANNRLLIASRWPVEQTHIRRAPKVDGKWLLVEVASPVPFAISAMHIPNSVTGNRYSYHDAALAVARGWKGLPALLVGDTNTGRIDIDEQSPVFSRRDDNWMTSLERAGWHDAFRHLYGETRVYTWYSPNKGNGFRLDQAFIHKSLLPRLRDVSYRWGKSFSLAYERGLKVQADNEPGQSPRREVEDFGVRIGPRKGGKLLLDERPLRRDVLSDHAALIVDFGP
jgi:exonuclease III